MLKPFSVPAHRNALPKPIASSQGGGVNPCYTPNAVSSPGPLPASSFMTPSMRQMHQGLTVPKVAVLPQNSGRRLPAVQDPSVSPVPGFSDIRPIALAPKGGAPAGRTPGSLTSQPGGAAGSAASGGGAGGGSVGGKVHIQSRL
jgi:hypothetical protein